MERTLVVPGDPVPWAEKQTNRKSGSRFIAPRQEEAIGRALDAIDRANLRHVFKLDEPLLLSAEFYVNRPKYHYGTGKNANTIKPAFADKLPTGRPDFSNLIKLIEDAMVLGEVLPDDDQIVGFYLPLRKVYTRSREERPRSVIRVKPVTP
jgi:crossover junction endodeoxyribonuclease RusA